MKSGSIPTEFAAPSECEHRWQPISFRFETQMLDEHGRVIVRQPDMEEGRVYFICMRCASHTYMSTQWIGWRMYGSEDAIGSEQKDLDGYNREAWILPVDEPEKEC